ncbi:MAG: ATP-binding protein [Alphaproteobacteria bacterium]|nr:ATP-binding protein [Alphaproteobacteria bacterium]
MNQKQAEKAAHPPFGQKGQKDWYAAAMEHLVAVVQDLSRAHDLDSVMTIVRQAARELTGADGATFVLRDGDKCFYAEENAISPLWKGQRFPMKTCISGWVMMNAQPAVIEDIYQDPRIPADAYRPTFVKSLAMVPVRRKNPVAAIGNYWAINRTPSAEEISILETLANFTSVALENVELYGRLQKKVQALEESNRELDRFAWIASHDLKSPLRAIDNLSRWIEEDAGPGLQGQARQNMQILRARVRRMEKLLDDILDYASIDHKLSVQPEEIVDGRVLQEDILELTYIPDGFNLTFVGDFSAIMAPRLALQRVLCVLVDNAIKHHDRGQGRIVISFEEQPGQYILCVGDDGPGIEPAYRNEIFNMFSTLQSRDTREGSGMGLALARKIMSLHGGAIELEETGDEGRGTKMRVTWPKSGLLLQQQEEQNYVRAAG